MTCPFCGHREDKVIDSRESKEGDVIRRRRECLACTGGSPPTSAATKSRTW
jgi:transcriptional regulator NrdR family protein